MNAVTEEAMDSQSSLVLEIGQDDGAKVSCAFGMSASEFEEGVDTARSA